MKLLFTRAFAALFSGNRAAYLGIFLKLIRPFSLLLDKKVTRTTSIPPIIFIVSPPRSGSTVTYQVLSRVISCAYFSNMHFLFPYKGSTLLFEKKRFNQNLPSGFKNYYGYTPTLNDVNEGNEVFDKLFNQTNTTKIREDFLDFISSFAIDNDTPIIFKNVRNYANIKKIAKAIPEIMFLEVERNYAQNIQSELKAHYELKTFHPIPNELKNINYLKDPVDFASKQITSIYKSIEQQLENVPSNKKHKVHYEQFCENPENEINKMTIHFGIEQFVKKEEVLKLNLRASFTKKVSDMDIKQIKDFLNKE